MGLRPFELDGENGQACDDERNAWTGSNQEDEPDDRHGYPDDEDDDPSNQTEQRRALPGGRLRGGIAHCTECTCETNQLGWGVAGGCGLALGFGGVHPVDFGARIALRFLPESRRVFVDGWGDPALLDLLDITQQTMPRRAAVEWERTWEEGSLRVRHGRFDSPVPELPAAAADGFVLEIGPRGGSGRVCVLLPAWNDEGFRTRRRLAEGLAGRGITSWLIEAPLYGMRRVLHGSTPIRTVADFAVMTRTIVEEARALIVEARAAGYHAGVAGFSMGGSLTAVTAATLAMPIAVAPLAAAHAPDAVFTQGVLRSSVAWEALGENAWSRLADQLGRPSVLRVPPTAATRRAVMVAASADGFVPRAAAAAIHHHWPGSVMRWVRAGHATLLWRRSAALVDGIAHAFERTTAI